MLIILEGLVMCFLLLLVCVVGIASGPVGLVVLYEQDVQDRVVELGLTSRERIRRNFIFCCLAMFVPVLILVPSMVYCINGAVDFWSGFRQMTAILLIQGLFDRFFIDWYWVGRTKAWIIPGTEDLQPYIPRNVLVRKWIGTLVGFPAIAAILAGIAELL